MEEKAHSPDLRDFRSVLIWEGMSGAQSRPWTEFGRSTEFPRNSIRACARFPQTSTAGGNGRLAGRGLDDAAGRAGHAGPTRPARTHAATGLDRDAGRPGNIADPARDPHWSPPGPAGAEPPPADSPGHPRSRAPMPVSDPAGRQRSAVAPRSAAGVGVLVHIPPNGPLVPDRTEQNGSSFTTPGSARAAAAGNHGCGDCRSRVPRDSRSVPSASSTTVSRLATVFDAFRTG